MAALRLRLANAPTPSVCLYAVRQTTRPLAYLAAAADTLDPNKAGPAISEAGPREVAHAARAFNAMRERIVHYLEERVQILAAISHDLQTPITRMRLRADMTDDSPEKDKLANDLAEIERLVRMALPMPAARIAMVRRLPVSTYPLLSIALPTIIRTPESRLPFWVSFGEQHRQNRMRCAAS